MIAQGSIRGIGSYDRAGRIKVPLTDIMPAHVAALGPRKRLEAHIAGRNEKG